MASAATRAIPTLPPRGTPARYEVLFADPNPPLDAAWRLRRWFDRYGPSSYLGWLPEFLECPVADIEAAARADSQRYAVHPDGRISLTEWGKRDRPWRGSGHGR